MSHEGIIEYLNQYITLNEEEKETVRKNSVIKEFPKGTMLLRQGEVAQESFMVLKGLIRVYHTRDGNEKTTDIFTEYHPFTPASYVTKTPSEVSIVCEEDCVLFLESMEKTQELFNSVPRLVEIGHLISSDLMAKQQVQYMDFKNLSPLERYQKLLETRPELVHRVKQYHLASYLGVKPETLSRIRKKISIHPGIS